MQKKIIAVRNEAGDVKKFASQSELARFLGTDTTCISAAWRKGRAVQGWSFVGSNAGFNAGFNVPNAGFNVPNAGFNVPNAGSNAGFNVPNAGFNGPNVGPNGPNDEERVMAIGSTYRYNSGEERVMDLNSHIGKTYMTGDAFITFVSESGLYRLERLVSLFRVEGKPFRYFIENGEAWFVKADIASYLEIKNTGTLAELDEDEERVMVIGSTYSHNSGEERVMDLSSTYSHNRRGDTQKITFVSESGLYKIILRSRKAAIKGTAANEFLNWVTREVLPSIRKTGRYDLEEAIQIRGRIAALARDNKRLTEETRQLGVQQTLLEDRMIARIQTERMRADNLQARLKYRSRNE